MSRRTALRLAAVVALLAAAAVTLRTGIVEWLGDPQEVTRFLNDSGPVGPLVYILGFSLTQPFGMPGILFVVPASLAWPTPLATLYSVLGAMGSGTVGYAFARWLAHDWVEAHLPPRLRELGARVRGNQLRSVIWIRLVFFLAQPAHWALGLAGVRITPLLVGSAIGFTPPMLLLVIGGREMVHWLRDQPPWAWLVAGALLLAGIVGHRRLTREAVDPAAAPGALADAAPAARGSGRG